MTTRTRSAHRMTVARARVLHQLLTTRRPFWPYGLAKDLGLAPSLVGRILTGLEEDGLAVSWWAGANDHSYGPRRHWYRLTPAAQGLTAAVDQALRP